MAAQRGDIWFADLNPIRGSEQAGIRPVVILQNGAIKRFTATGLSIPLTPNLRGAALPSCVQSAQREGGLSSDSVILCHQLPVLDKSRLQRRLGSVSPQTMAAVERCVLFTLGIS